MANEIRFSKEELIEIMEKYHVAEKENNTKIISELMGPVIESMQQYIESYLHRCFPSYYQREKEDMIQAAYVVIMENFTNYDPEKAKLITWAKSHILHAGQMYVDKNFAKTTAHYSQNIKKITKEQKLAEKQGIILDAQGLSEKTGIPITTVTKCLNIMNNTTTVCADSSDFIKENLMTSEESPERELIKKEEIETIHKYINCLSEEEKTVILCKYGFANDKAMNSTEIANYTGIKKENIKRLAANAERTLRQSLQRENLFNNKFIRAEIKVINKEITFTPKDDVSILKQTLASLEEVEIDF